MESLIFPADGAADRNESAALRRELDEARKQGEVYARELAAIFDRGEEVTAASTMPPAPGVAPGARLAAMTKICSGVAADLQNALGSLTKDLAAMRAREVTEEQLDTLRRRMAYTHEVISMLREVGQVRPDELDTEIDLGEVARNTVRAFGAHAERDGVSVVVRIEPEGSRVYVRRGPKATTFLVRQLVAHAIEASPRGTRVDVILSGHDGTVQLKVDDAGSPLPASGRRAFLSLETHAGAYGRPSGLPIFLAAELASCQGAILELSDAPSGGLRVAVTFAASVGFAKS
jgi:signal transduction histidine kinase